jgi:hypothetical protein
MKRASSLDTALIVARDEVRAPAEGVLLDLDAHQDLTDGGLEIVQLSGPRGRNRRRPWPRAETVARDSLSDTGGHEGVPGSHTCASVNAGLDRAWRRTSSSQTRVRRKALVGSPTALVTKASVRRPIREPEFRANEGTARDRPEVSSREESRAPPPAPRGDHFRVVTVDQRRHS